MFRRYHHGHSAIGGFLLALSLHAHTLWLVTAALVLGLVIGRAWAFWADAARAIKCRLLRTPQRRTPSVPVPVYSQGRMTSSADDVPY